MASEVDIANRALSKLGEARITSLSEASKPARAMNARYEHLRDAELEAHPWRFAVTRTTLPKLSAAPSWGYANEYQRPADDLRPLAIGDHAIPVAALGLYYSSSGYDAFSGAPFEIINGNIHTDLGAPLKYEYIARVANSGAFPAQFVEALACRLAVDACEELTQSASKFDRVEAMYREAIKTARRTNMLYRPPSTRPTGPWNRARA